MKNILLMVHDDPGQEARLQAALDVVRAVEGHLTCLDVMQLPDIPGGDYYTAMGGTALIEHEREITAANRARIEPRIAAEGVPWDWRQATGDLAHSMIEAATLADLIVLNRKLDDGFGPDMHDVASTVLMHARRPVLAVPEGVRRFDAAGRALIAWDGQESAARTMRACAPLLALAGEVKLLMVRDGAERTEPTEAAEYLSRHGIHPTIHVVEDGLTAPDVLIAEECRSWGASYCLMGAYGRGRMLEVFGGVTKRLLASSEVPLILGH